MRQYVNNAKLAILFVPYPFPLAMLAILSLESRSSSTDLVGMRLTKPLSCATQETERKTPAVDYDPCLGLSCKTHSKALLVPSPMSAPPCDMVW